MVETALALSPFRLAKGRGGYGKLKQGGNDNVDDGDGDNENVAGARARSTGTHSSHGARARSAGREGLTLSKDAGVAVASTSEDDVETGLSHRGRGFSDEVGDRRGSPL